LKKGSGKHNHFWLLKIFHLSNQISDKILFRGNPYKDEYITLQQYEEYRAITGFVTCEYDRKW
jgi:hypothetical protein